MSFMLVGEAPTRSAESTPKEWLVPNARRARTTANRLRDIAGWDTQTYLQVFPIRTNAVPHAIRGRVTKEDRQLVLVRSETVLDMVRAHSLAGVVCLGRLFANAVGAPKQPFAWAPWRGTVVAYFPHTSGRSRFWNDPANIIRGRGFLLQLADIAGVGKTLDQLVR